MNIVFFSAHSYDKTFFNRENQQYQHQLRYLDVHLNASTVMLAEGADAVCVFVNDTVDQPVLEKLAQMGTRLVALRCAGFNNVDLEVAQRLGIAVVRVPNYSPYAVAEHAVALILCLNRKIHVAHNRVRDGNFRLAGLLGFDLYDKTVGVIGTGKIGEIFCRIMRGFGCEVIANDPQANPECLAMGVTYTDIEDLLHGADIISLHCPLTPQTYHLLNDQSLPMLKDGVMIVNTSRGALIDARALVAGLKAKKIGSVALDVYEEEADLFFDDLSSEVIQDDVFARLLTFPNVIVTSHQAFFTHEAVSNIAATTLANIIAIEKGTGCENVVLPSGTRGRAASAEK